MAITVRPLTPDDGPACDAIMRGLPDFFSYEPGLGACAAAVRLQGGFVAEEDGEVLGFATWEPKTDETAEVTWMAVKNDRRGAGIGTLVIEAVANEMREKGYRLALAMTSARPKDHTIEDTYGPTRAFWTARGFLPLIELDVWETDVALLQVRALVLP